MYLKVKVAKFIYLSFVFVWSITSCSLTRKLPAKNYLLKANLVNYNKFKNLKLEYKTPLLIEQQENNYLEYDLRIKENK